MKMTLSQLFGRLESLTAKLNIELDLPDNPAPGTLQEAAKKGGVSGVFGFLGKLVDGSQQAASDPLNDVVAALTGLLKQQAPPMVSQTEKNGSDLLRTAGAKGIDAFAKAIADLLPKDQTEPQEKAASGKDPEVGAAEPETVAQLDTDRAEVINEPPEAENKALASDNDSFNYTNSTAIV